MTELGLDYDSEKRLTETIKYYRELLNKAITLEYTPDRRIYPVSVIAARIKCSNKIEKSLEELQKKIQDGLAIRRDWKKFQVTRPKRYGDLLEIKFFRPVVRRSYIPTPLIDNTFSEIVPIPIKIVPPDYLATIYLKIHNDYEMQIFVIGGKEDFRDIVLHTIKRILLGILECENSKALTFRFKAKQMYAILEEIVENVAYVNVDPKYNTAFAKILSKESKKQPRPEDVVYLVDFIKIRGYKITKSPGVLKLIKEKGIIIDEIIGQWKIEDYKVTMWVRRNGIVTFYIPSRMAESDEDARLKAMELYMKLMSIVPKEVEYPDLSKF